mgnify:CR=1 FL=1
MIRTANRGPWNADETACWRCEGCDSPLNKLRVGAPSNHPRAGRTQQLNRTGKSPPDTLGGLSPRRRAG